MTRGERDGRRWTVLGVGLLGLIAGCATQYGLAYLIPALRSTGLALEEATLLAIAPIAGIMCTLIAWGAAADRWGERRILVLGLGTAGLAELGAAAVSEPIVRWLLLFAAGATSAAIHAASGRLILGWFGVGERGLAMGIRQMGQPLGVGAAAVVLPPLAESGIPAAFVALGAGCLASAALISLAVRDPVRGVAGGSAVGSPYREPYLWRIHLSSGLLVIPQVAIAIFAFDYLVTGLGWSIGAAGVLLAVTQVVGALSRLGAGWWSDRVGSRLRPMRLVALAVAVAMASLGVLGAAGVPAAVVALAAAAVVTTSPNGLAFTAVAERAGSRWAGRALGVQNTVQNVLAAAVPMPLALLVTAAGGGAVGYALVFASVVVAPVAAIVTIPASDERIVA